MKDIGTPLREAERLEWIDAARGLAIFGIFMVNVPAFNAPYFLYGGEEIYWSSGTSHTIQAIIDIFFQASFYTLFSFLFGFGIEMMRERLVDKGLRAKYVIGRRLVILIGFGLIHAFLIWHGDILLSYGLIGLLLLFFLNRKKKTLLAWGFSMLLIFTVFFTFSLYSLGSDYGGWVNEPAIEQAEENYGNGTLFDIWSQNLNDWNYTNAPMNWPFLIMSLLPMFLFGMYIARKKWLHQPKRHKKALVSLWAVTFLLFLVFKAGPYLFGNPAWFQLMQDNIGGSASAVFYVVSVTLLYQSPIGKRWLRGLSYVGKLSLSNYILQSLFAFLLFYSVGFGLYGQVSPLWSVIIVVLFYSVQTIASKWWLQSYRYGPLEWVWRTLTYGKKQPLRRRQEG
ncbi:DUF418 domain-containing protein [Thalassobacillus devorans]|uniref:DUF418 domain-containing protein n=1 Tax=Thalassobacillus devorans TaxID=279813 RepID=UPI0015944018|nr:DUF418 domain-containing protein [Thalassobacillus devorans]